MDIPWSDLQGFAGATGVGALVILAAFLALDGLNPQLFPEVEAYSKSGTWAVVAAVPTLAMAYVIGLLVMGLGQVTIGLVSGIKIEPTEAVAFRQGAFELVQRIYSQTLQEANVLGGSALALAGLALGALFEMRNLPHLKRVIAFVAMCTLLAAIGAGALGAERMRDSSALAAAVRAQPHP